MEDYHLTPIGSAAYNSLLYLNRPNSSPQLPSPPPLEPSQQINILLTQNNYSFFDKIFELWSLLHNEEAKQYFKQRCLDNPQTDEERMLGQALEVIINPF